MSATAEETAEKIRRLEDRLRVLSDVTRAFAEDTSDYPRLLETVARRLSEVVKDLCAVVLLSEDGETLEYAALHTPDAEALRALRRLIPANRFKVADEPMARRVLESGEAFLAPHFAPAPMRPMVSASVHAITTTLGMHSRLIVALRLRGRAIGLLSLGRFRQDSPPFDEHDRDLVQILADHAALAIDNARSYRVERAARLAAVEARAVAEALERGLGVRTAELSSKSEELASSERRYRTLFENAHAVIGVATADGILLDVNRAWERAVGYSRAEAVGRSITDFAPLDAKAARKLEYESSVSQGGGAVAAMPIRRRDGSLVHIETSRTIVEIGGERQVLSIGSDVTERIALEEQLREAQKSAETKQRDYQERLQGMAFDAAVAEERERHRLAVVLHDGIGQDLALVQIKLAAVRAEARGAAGVAIDEALALLTKSAGERSTLIFDLSPPVLYDLGIKDALGWLSEDLEKRHGMRVSVVDDGKEKSLDDTTAAIAFRAVRELLVNVLKHARTPAARVSLRRAGEHLDIVVEDAGVGFDAGESDSSARTGGFGLFSVKDQIHRLGGEVEITSTKGRGTSARLRVPLEHAVPPARDAKEVTP